MVGFSARQAGPSRPRYGFAKHGHELWASLSDIEMSGNERGGLLRLVAALSPRVRQGVQSTALAVLIAGVASAAIELSRWHPRSTGSASPSAPERLTPSLVHDQRLVPVAPEPALSEAPPAGAASALAVGSALASSPLSAKFKSPSELFADANQARV